VDGPTTGLPDVPKSELGTVDVPVLAGAAGAAGTSGTSAISGGSPGMKSIVMKAKFFDSSYWSPSSAGVSFRGTLRFTCHVSLPVPTSMTP
jgi:hypothetical protein